MESQREISSRPELDDVEYVLFDPDLGLENLNGYCEGGFHPVYPGDVLGGGRYKVVHKLGSGGFGIVWLCLEPRTGQWWAIKILRADCSAAACMNGEAAISVYLRCYAPSGPRDQLLEQNHIAPSYDSFWLDGPNGRHLCLVGDVLGESASAWCAYRVFTTPDRGAADVRRVCRQATEALHFLHSHGVVHGDLRPPNMLMQLRRGALDGIDESGMLKLLGQTARYPVELADGSADPGPRAPRWCVRPASGAFRYLCTGSVALVDFGAACRIGDPQPSAGIPDTFAAPEVLLGQGQIIPSPASDVWALACTIFRLRGGCDLFGKLAARDPFGIAYVVMGWELYLGPLVEPYRSLFIGAQNERSAGNRPGGFNANLQDTVALSDRVIEWVRREQASNHPSTVREYDSFLERELGKIRNITWRNREREIEFDAYWHPREEVVMLADLLRKMWKFNPAERASLYDILQHPWMRGLPVPNTQ